MSFDMDSFMKEYKDDMRPFLKKFCNMHLFQRFVERDIMPKTPEDYWETILFKNSLPPASVPKKKNLCN